MNPNSLTRAFEAHRTHLAAVARRLLGPGGEVDDALQETWIRLQRSDVADVENLGGWLTTVVARVSLSMLRARGARPDLPPDHAPSPGAAPDPATGPEDEAVVADAVGAALLVVLDTLAPAERLAFVLHDLFAVPFDEIALVVDRSPGATRQLASRARRRVQGAPEPETGLPDRRREIVEAFLAASREGRFADLLTVLDPDVVLRADQAAVKAAAYAGRGAPDVSEELYGAEAVAHVFSGRASAAQPALVDGGPAAAWAPGGRPRSLIRLTIAGERIVGVEVVADPARIAELDVVLL